MDSDVCFDAYTILSTLPSISVSPFSRLRFFTFKSLPLIIILPRVVVKSMVALSNSETSKTPVIVPLFLPESVNLCGISFGFLYNSSNPPQKYIVILHYMGGGVSIFAELYSIYSYYANRSRLFKA